MSDYATFLSRKVQDTSASGFEPLWLPDFLFPFQRHLTEWAIRRGRAAIFADCGLGKTAMELVWAENVARKTGLPVLILTPLAVSYQIQAEGEKFGVEVARSQNGSLPARIVVTNYERLGAFAPEDFAGVVCDESSILKSFEGVRRKQVTEFMRTRPYRLLATATAAPNDYVELGTSSEALGELGHMDMLARFWVNDQHHSNPRLGWRTHGGGDACRWRFRGHAETPFWRWVASWARACRHPSDLGFGDERFVLPPLEERHHVVAARARRPDMLFDVPAIGIREEREERRRTLAERCEKVAELVRGADQALVWCHLNAEGDRLARVVDGAVQVKGGDADEVKEEALMAFARGEVRVLVTKPKIGAWGLNLQRCAHVVAFPTHSYEQHYQGIRRCWRFGQTRPVIVDVVSTEGEREIAANLARKATAADRMFAALVRHMRDAQSIWAVREGREAEVPAWL